jgi:hypothetical protein
MPLRRQFPCQSVSEPTDGPGPVRQDRGTSRTGPATGVRSRRGPRPWQSPASETRATTHPVDDEQDVQGHGLDFDGMDDSGLAETQGPGRIRAMDDPRANQQ